MVEERPSAGSVRKRPALADVTNRQAKKAYVPPSKDSIGLKKPDVVGQTLKENTSSGSSRVPNEFKEPSRLVKINLCFDTDEAVRQEALKKGDASKYSNTPSVSKHEGDVKCSKSENSSSEIVVESGKSKDESDDKEIANPVVPTDVIDLDPSYEELDTNVVGNAGEGMDDDDLISNKSSSSLCLEPSASSSSKNFESEACTGFNVDGGSDSITGLDMLKTCSCSFCLKAAHIWSDLHYQDAKGRIAALKKSRKEVRSLVERSSIPADLAKYCQGNPSMKLELDLMSRWRSLFLHTEDILVRESNQLHSSLLTLKDLRDNCKADLEMITGNPSNKN